MHVDVLNQKQKGIITLKYAWVKERTLHEPSFHQNQIKSNQTLFVRLISYQEATQCSSQKEMGDTNFPEESKKKNSLPIWANKGEL